MNDQSPHDPGAEFRTAREDAGVSLRHIADVTKLPLNALKALEEGRIDKLPGGIYRRAIVRAYASEVGLDPERTVRAFVERFPDEVPSSTSVASEPPLRAPRRLHALLGFLGGLVPVVVGVIYLASGTAGYEPVGSSGVSSTRSGVAPATPPVARASLGGVNALAMQLSASARTRVAVIADGREVVARLLEPGEVVRVGITDEVVLIGDNAGAVHFSINGIPGRALGEDGTPLRARILRDDYLSWLIQP